MTFLKKSGDGNYYVCRRPGGSTGQYGSRGVKGHRNWFFVINQGGIKRKAGVIHVGYVSLPEEFVGKKVRLKVEVIEEE